MTRGHPPDGGWIGWMEQFGIRKCQVGSRQGNNQNGMVLVVGRYPRSALQSTVE
jgi:hypothetical protein